MDAEENCEPDGTIIIKDFVFSFDNPVLDDIHFKVQGASIKFSNCEVYSL